MERSIVALVLGSVVALGGCGGGADTGPPVPLVSGSLAGDYKGNAFTPMNGFAALYEGTNVIAVGDGPLNCASLQQPDPPSGTNAMFTVPALEVGTYSNRVVQIYRNVGSFEGYGTNSGSVTLTTVTDTSVAGSVQYNHTNDVGETFSLSGSFEIMRCAN